jgi:hypothetical protein
MAGPFFNNIKGTTAGTPGTGAFTPNAASADALAWSTVPAGWIGLVRFEDGSAWELQYSYWNGTTLSRSATAQFVSSSTGSGLTLTSAATAALVEDGSEIAPHLSIPLASIRPIQGSTTLTSFAATAPVVSGTAGGVNLATTNYLTEQVVVKYTSVTTANGQAGWTSGTMAGLPNSTAGRGGWEFTQRFGASALPTGPRAFIGMTTVGFFSNTGEPSALAAHYAVLGLDSTDTNFQLMVNAGTTGTKTNTGIPWVANGFYEATIWTDPGSTTVKMLFIRLDTGAIFYGSTSTNVPATGSLLTANALAGLNGTNTGTALVLHLGNMTLRNGAG